MLLYLYIGVFGGIGCLSRFVVSGWVSQLVGRNLPYGTLAVNALGSLLLGVVLTAGLRNPDINAELRIGISVGFMGGFTTFSTFSYETLRLFEEGNLWHAGANILLNLSVCLFAVLLGVQLARQF